MNAWRNIGASRVFPVSLGKKETCVLKNSDEASKDVGEEISVRNFHFPRRHEFVHFFRWLRDLHLRAVQSPSIREVDNVSREFINIQ